MESQNNTKHLDKPEFGSSKFDQLERAKFRARRAKILLVMSGLILLISGCFLLIEDQSSMWAILALFFAIRLFYRGYSVLKDSQNIINSEVRGGDKL